MVVCVECGKDVVRLFRDYGKRNIRLKRCEHCGAVADKYIELDQVNIVLEMLLLKEPVFRHSIFNVKDYAINSKCPEAIPTASPRDLSPSYVFGDNLESVEGEVAKEGVVAGGTSKSSLGGLRLDVIRSVLLMGLSDIYVKLRGAPVNQGLVLWTSGGSSMMERIDNALHRVLFSQVAHPAEDTVAAWSYIGITAAATVELIAFLAAITVGVLLVRNKNDPSAMRLKAFDIAVAAGVSQVGKVAPVILMIWSSAPDIRLAVASFNLSTCVVVVKLTSGRKGTPALVVVLMAVAIRLLIQWLVAEFVYTMYPCSIISAFG